jgi:hypothetical protein
MTVSAKLNRTALPASTPKFAQPPRLTATGDDDIRDTLDAHKVVKFLGIIGARQANVSRVFYRLAWQSSLNTENAAVKTENTTCARVGGR